MAPNENFIGGEFVAAKSGRTDPVVDPATGETIAEVPSSDAADVVRAFAVTREVFGLGERMAAVEQLDGQVPAAVQAQLRHEQQRRAMLHKEVTVQGEDDQDVSVTLDIVPDEFEPYAQLKAFDPYGELLAEAKVSAGFKLNKASAERWVASGFERPAA